MGNVILTPTGGTAGTYSGGGTGAISGSGTNNVNITNNNLQNKNSFIPVQFNAKQIAGLVPLWPCGAVDCRDTQQEGCFFLPVFGTPGATTSTYKNDINDFWVSFNGQGIPKFTIQKAKQIGTALSWSDLVDITASSPLGQYYKLGSIVAHPTYMAYLPNWGGIVNTYGPGFYRIHFSSCITTIIKGVGATQSISPGFVTPYYRGSINSYWNSVTSIIMSVQIKCGATTYTVPFFNVGKTSILANITTIIAACNAYFTANNLPFTCIADPSNPTQYWCIQGKNYAAQNGCDVTAFFKYYAGTTLLDAPTIVSSVMKGGNNGANNTIVNCTCGLESPPFHLRKWNCFQTHGTVKFECMSSGTQGDPDNDGELFDLCGLTIYDSIRVRGFFGTKSGVYSEMLLEAGFDPTHEFGEQISIRNKIIPKWKWNGFAMPEWVHWRLATIAFMADKKVVSDYNLNNSSYDIIQKSIAKPSGYEPKYLDQNPNSLNRRYLQRRCYVQMTFEAGIQSIIKSTCCEIIAGPIINN